MSNYKKFADLPNSSKEQKVVSSPLVLEINNAEQKKQLVAQNKAVVIDIYGNFCGPCKMIAPQFVKLAETYKNIIFAKENVELRISPEVQGVPYFQFYFNGQLVDKTVGANMNEIQYKLNQLQEYLKSS
jgi:thioredoxin 1